MSNKIDIDLLSPAEAVVVMDKVDNYKNKLSKGEELEPVVIVNLEGKLLVTDGNNRARALVEYNKDNLDNVICKIAINERATEGASDTLKQEWIMIAEYYGKGGEAFLKIRVATKFDYYKVQAEVIGEMRKSTQNLK